MIVIKGMEMPSNCLDCEFFSNYLNTKRCDFTLEEINETEYGRASECPLVEVVASKDSLKQASDKYKIEQEIREELERLGTYRIPNTKTDLVSLNAVKRILNLVFRGCTDLEPKNICNKEWLDDSN